jgi:DNA-binding NarL/FixJ family response regulator
MTTQFAAAAEERVGQMPTKAAIVAVDAIARRRLRALLESDGIAVCAVAEDATALSSTPGADVIVVAVDGDASASAAQVQAVLEKAPEQPLVVVARAPSQGLVRRVLEAGADGLVEDEPAPGLVAATISAVQAGQLSLPKVFRAQTQQPVLSMRERQALGLVAMGLTNGQIAARLYLAESTVKSHLSTAFAKLGVRSRSEAATLILQPNSSIGPAILAIAANLEV